MVNKSVKLMMIKPNIINNIDVFFINLIFKEKISILFFINKIGKRFNHEILDLLPILKFEQIFMVINNILTTYYRCKFHMNAKFSHGAKCSKISLSLSCLI